MENCRSWRATALHLTKTTMTTIAVMTCVHATIGAASSSFSTSRMFPASSAPNVATENIPQSGNDVYDARKMDVENALDVIEAASTGSMDEDCATMAGYKILPAGAALDPHRFDVARQKTDMAAMMLQNLESMRHTHLLDAVAKSLLISVTNAIGTRVVIFNTSTESVITSTWLTRPTGSIEEPTEIKSDALRFNARPDPSLPWFNGREAPRYHSRSSKFVHQSALKGPTTYMGWWTLPYLSCKNLQWLISYSVYVRPLDAHHGLRAFLSIDMDLGGLEINQCNHMLGSDDKHAREGGGQRSDNQIASFRGSHKCHEDTTQCEYRGPSSRRNSGNEFESVSPGWRKGAYICRCREGFYSLNSIYTDTGDEETSVFDGILVEAAWKEMQNNKSSRYNEMFRCIKCAPGCTWCKGPEPCLATYNWPFRITLLSVSVFCACGAVLLVAYVYQHRKLKVFKVASPIFLSITLLGCAIMYLEMAAIFPVLDVYSCVATKWTRHFGFCISYTALLMKTWRVSLTYRVKSAHKVKLTDKQLLQWMVPILLVMLIYLGTWTLSAPPHAKVIADSQGLEFYQCSYNWWDHSLAIGEILFLAWGIRVCYNVRNAESLFNEARLISYAIYNIAAVNTTMIAIHLFIFPHAGPDMKYSLGFLRTQLSTTVTILLVFGPKVLRVLRGHGDQWDSRARARGITASFSLNGIRGLVAEETTDLYQENEELKEEIQKLAAQIEFMKIVHMEMHNRHIKPKLGGYFSTPGSSWSAQSPNAKTSTASFILKSAVERGATAAAAAAVEDSTFPSGSLHRARRMELLRERKAAREKEREKERSEQSKAEQMSPKTCVPTEKDPTAGTSAEEV